MILLRGGARRRSRCCSSAHAEGALHGRRVGLPRRRRRRDRGRRATRPTASRPSASSRRRPRSRSSDPERAREVLALDHARRGAGSASTRTSSSRRRPTARSRASTARSASTAAGSRPQAALDAHDARRDPARLPDDQAPRAARRLRHRGRAARPRPRARGRPVSRGSSPRARSRGSCCPASPATTAEPNRAPPRPDGSTVPVCRRRPSRPTSSRSSARFITTEYVTIDARGPADHLARHALLPRAARAASTSRPASATRRRPTTPRATRTSPLLFSDPTGCGLDDPPMVLVQGTARRRRRRPRRQPRALRARGGREAARRTKQLAAAGVPAGASSLVLRPHLRPRAARARVRVAATATSTPSPSCSTPTWRRSAPGHVEEPEEAHRRPRAACRDVGRAASTSSAGATRTAVLSFVAPDGFPFAVRVPVEADRAAHRVRLDADPLGAPSSRARRASRPRPRRGLRPGSATSRCRAT